MTDIQSDKLSKDERDALIYAESCLVEYGGLLEGMRMNSEDLKALAMFKEQGLLDFGRVPGKLVGNFVGRSITHWVEFKDGAWQLAHQLRRERCERARRNSANYASFKAALDAPEEANT